MINLERALNDPQGVFESPCNVVVSDEISSEDKIRILRQWEYDARELEVAEEENMGGGAPDLLGEVLEALRALGAEDDPKQGAPTKHGGT